MGTHSSPSTARSSLSAPWEPMSFNSVKRASSDPRPFGSLFEELVPQSALSFQLIPNPGFDTMPVAQPQQTIPTNCLLLAPEIALFDASRRIIHRCSSSPWLQRDQSRCIPKGNRQAAFSSRKSHSECSQLGLGDSGSAPASVLQLNQTQSTSQGNSQAAFSRPRSLATGLRCHRESEIRSQYSQKGHADPGSGPDWQIETQITRKKCPRRVCCGRRI